MGSLPSDFVLLNGTHVNCVGQVGQKLCGSAEFGSGRTVLMGHEGLLGQVEQHWWASTLRQCPSVDWTIRQSSSRHRSEQ